MRLFAFSIFLPLLLACGHPSDESETQSLVLDKPGSRWPNPRAIPVCIVNRNDVGDELYDDIRSYVITQYRTRAGVGFTGWKSCTVADHKSNVIRIYFNRTHSWASSYNVTAGGGLSQVGQNLVSCATACYGATMRLDVGRNGDYSKGNELQSFIVSRSRSAAIHEFGHALGLMHEHEREDAPGCMKAGGAVVSGANYLSIGSYDSLSIMNYCQSGQSTSLSEGDVKGIHYLYPELNRGLSGRPDPGSVPI